MSQKPPPAFTPFNKRDMITLAKMLGPLLFVLTIGIYFHSFVWHAISVNIGINMGIISAASFGIFLIISRLIDAQEDFRIIERFGYEAKQGVYMKTLLEQPWLNNRYVRHYLHHIANTGGTLSTQLEHSAIESELHALHADYESRMEMPQFLVGFMIAMGLLGTFIGLLETLTGISGMLDGIGGNSADVTKEFSKLVVELRKPLAGMGIAFSASMFGLITSLMLAIMMTNLRRYVSRVMSLARNVMHELTEMARENKGGGTMATRLSPADIDAMLTEDDSASLPARTETPMDSDTVAAHHSMFGTPMGGGVGLDPALAGRFELMTKKMDLLLESIADNTENTRRLNDLIGFGPRMKEISEKTLDEIRHMSTQSVEQHRLLQSLASQISESREVAIGSGRHLNEIKENFTKLSKSSGVVELIASSIGGQTALLEALIEEVRRSQQGLAVINKSILERR